MRLACSRGAIAIEFAFIAPILMLLLAGMVEFGNVYLVRNQMSEVAREAARRIATDKLSPDGALAFVGNRLADTIDSTVGVTVTETSLGDDGSADLTVVLSVPLADVMTFGFWLPSAAAAEPSMEATPADSDPYGGQPSQPMMLKVTATMLKE